MSFSSLDLTNTFSSFAGVDIRVMIGPNVVGEMQAISYAVQREKAPIYVMGHVDPLSFSRGKRGIAGTMISLLLDKHILAGNTFAGQNTAILDVDEVIAGPSFVSGAGDAADPFVGGALGGTGDDLSLTGGGALGASLSVDNIDDLVAETVCTYVDQILPFDVTIIAANEYGSASVMRLYGCEILNEGSGFSIDDIVIENQMTYVCRVISPWRQLGKWSFATAASGTKDAEDFAPATNATFVPAT